MTTSQLSQFLHTLAGRGYRQRTAEARGATRKTMIVALARKLLIGLWRMAITGEVPEGVVLRSAA